MAKEKSFVTVEVEEGNLLEAISLIKEHVLAIERITAAFYQNGAVSEYAKKKSAELLDTTLTEDKRSKRIKFFKLL